MDLTTLTIKQAHEGLKNKKFTSVDLTRAYLEKIKETDKELNAFLSVDEKSALEQAELADKKIVSGNFGMLTGIPCAIKDNIMVEGKKCTAASKILENYVAPYNATVIKKLKEQGIVILGKTNLDEFAMGSSTENSAFKITKNPRDLTRVPGGSSGGSAAAVAGDECCWALGSETNGSVRLPASFCGIVGLKPTYGAVSRYGLIAFGSSLDQIGPLTKNVEDAKIIFDVISGKDPMDATSADYKFKEADTSLKGLKIGVPKEYFAEGLDKDVEKIIRNTIKKAEDAGAEIIEISLPSTKYALAAYYIVAPSEASANLARFDGIKYGLSIDGKDLLDVYLKSKGHGFGAEVKRRIMIGTYALSSGYYDAYYKKSQEVIELIKQDFVDAFKKVDLILAPVCPTTAFKIGERIKDPLAMYLTDILNSGSSLAGLPGLSMPVGKIAHSTGSGQVDLPVGLQIIGNHFQENKIISVAEEIEKLV
jgi:aspartyl-tRNA(Asn)/glutamyl-tRNA(Gln) amidotransferase subunit A